MMFSREALRLIVDAFPKVLESPSNLRARGHMLLAAAYAGTAIENSMLGAAHAAANPLTAHFGIMHGEAVGLMLPGVVGFNAADPAARATYAALAQRGGLVNGEANPQEAVDVLITRLGQLLGAAGLPRSLQEAGADAAQIPLLAEEAARQWTATFN